MKRVLAVLVFAACSSEDGPSIVMEDFHPPKVGPASQTWKDKTSGIQFRTEGEGWSRIESAELAAFAPDAKLAVRQGPRCSGWMGMRAAEGVGARAAADASRATVAWDALEVHVDEDVKYDAWTARRYEVQGKVGGRTHAERATFFLDRGTLYTLVARTDERDYGSRRRCLDGVTHGFALGLPSP